MKRHLRNYLVDYKVLTLKLSLLFVLSMFISVSFLDLGKPEDDPTRAIQNRTGFIYIVSIAFFMVGNNLASTALLPEKAIYDRDKNSRLYHPGSFFFSAILFPIPLFSLLFIVISIILFYLNKLNGDPWTNILWALGFTVGNGLISGLAVGSMVGVLAPNLKTVSAISPLITLPNMLVIGSFVSVRSLTWPLFLLSYMTPVRFIF